MDQPQHQVFNGSTSYRYMSHPFKKQPLHLLYPGRYMSNQYHFTGDNIPNEDPEGLDRTRDDIAILAKASRMEQEAFARHLGGKDPVVYHPAVEPEATIEDPDLKYMGVPDLPNPNLEVVNDFEDNLKLVEKDYRIAKSIVDRSVKNERPTKLEDPDYDWSSLDPGTLPGGYGDFGNGGGVIETYATNVRRNEMYTPLKSRKSKTHFNNAGDSRKFLTTNHSPMQQQSIGYGVISVFLIFIVIALVISSRGK